MVARQMFSCLKQLFKTEPKTFKTDVSSTQNLRRIFARPDVCKKKTLSRFKKQAGQNFTQIRDGNCPPWSNNS